MSIAVSTVINQSRLLSGLIGGMCVALFVIASIVLLGGVGDISNVARAVVASACVVVGAYVFFRTLKSRGAHEIHISGTGQIRLSVLQKGNPVGVEQGELVYLLADSTLWSSLLLLRLQNEKQQIHSVVILPDSVSKESFRALLVACRWIVMRHADVDNRYIDEN